MEESNIETDALYQFTQHFGYIEVAGEKKYRHTLQLMFSHKEAIRFAEGLLKQLNDPEDWPLVIVELHGKMIVHECAERWLSGSAVLRGEVDEEGHNALLKAIAKSDSPDDKIP